MSVGVSMSTAISTSREYNAELDSHADKSVGSGDCLIIHVHDWPVDVYDYGSRGKRVPICSLLQLIIWT